MASKLHGTGRDGAEEGLWGRTARARLWSRLALDSQAPGLEARLLDKSRNQQAGPPGPS